MTKHVVPICTIPTFESSVSFSFMELEIKSGSLINIYDDIYDGIARELPVVDY